jgi:hypothetical protein
VQEEDAENRRPKPANDRPMPAGNILLSVRLIVCYERQRGGAGFFLYKVAVDFFILGNLLFCFLKEDSHKLFQQRVAYLIQYKRLAAGQGDLAGFSISLAG